MATYKTPDVYIEEISVLPPSVAEVETAVPAFIGYTEKANKNGINDLILKPTKIYSLKEYERYYGLAADDKVEISVTNNSGSLSLVSVTEPGLKYLLYYSMKMFFDNGGGQCYIISVGTYQDPAVIDLEGGADDTAPVTSRYGLKDGLDVLKSEDEPTLIVIPEAVNLATADYQTLVQAVLLQCNTLQDRFAIFDLFDGDKALDSDGLSSNRTYFGSDFLKYGAAYYPFIKTTLNYYVNSAEDNVNVKVTLDAATSPSPEFESESESGSKTLGDLKTTDTALYNYVKTILKDYFVVLPPSAAVAGAYAAIDSNRGVWKAPANISLANVIEPVVNDHRKNCHPA